MKKLLLVILLPAILTACTTTAPRTMIPLNMSAALTGDGNAWRSCVFRITRLEQAEPNWGVDLLLAPKIVGPVLAQPGKRKALI